MDIPIPWNKLIDWLKNHLLKPEERTHDKQVFTTSESILSESQFQGFTGLLRDAYAYQRAGLASVINYSLFFRTRIANHFFDKHIQRSLDNLLGQIDAFLEFEQHHFKNYPGQDDRRLCGLTEEWGEKEWALAKQCDDLVTATQGAYRKFRENVLIKLKV